ncbi:hypothetical protein D3C79_453990 [compost metagenome]
MQHHKLVPQLFVAFAVLRINHNGVIDRAYLLTGWNIVMTNAFGAAIAIDPVDILPHRNGLIRAFRLAHIAVDAFLGYQQCHFSFLSIGALGQARNLP